MSERLLQQERDEVAAAVDALLERQLGYRCAFAVVWVKASTVPAMTGYVTNVSARDAVGLLQGVIDSLEGVI
jgi:xanthosine utilization system XapX-like protein